LTESSTDYRIKQCDSWQTYALIGKIPVQNRSRRAVFSGEPDILACEVSRRQDEAPATWRWRLATTWLGKQTASHRCSCHAYYLTS